MEQQLAWKKAEEIFDHKGKQIGKKIKSYYQKLSDPPIQIRFSTKVWLYYSNHTKHQPFFTSNWKCHLAGAHNISIQRQNKECKKRQLLSVPVKLCEMNITNITSNNTMKNSVDKIKNKKEKHCDQKDQ